MHDQQFCCQDWTQVESQDATVTQAAEGSEGRGLSHLLLQVSPRLGDQGCQAAGGVRGGD